MKKTLLFISFLTAVLLASASIAQSTRSLSGALTLDVGPSNTDRTLLLTIRNHSFVVLPSLAILRPITSARSVTVELLKNSSSVNYSIDNILVDPVDYSITIECISCTNDFPFQYYAPTGNRLGQTNDTFIDPDELPSTLNISTITNTSIDGTITLNSAATRDLEFRLSVLSAQDSTLVLQTSSPVISSGQSSITYSVSGLNRAIGSDQYLVQLQCLSCTGPSRKRQIFNRALSPNQNHSNIDFIATDEPFNPITPILNLLLE